MAKLKTLTKEFEVDSFTQHTNPNCLYISITDSTPNEINDTFCDHLETQNIEYNGTVYEGYTHFGCIELMLNSVKVRLTKNG